MIDDNNTVIPQYTDLQSLIFQNADARQYYNELPKETRKRLEAHSGDINTFENLREYAEEVNHNG